MEQPGAFRPGKHAQALPAADETSVMIAAGRTLTLVECGF
jgi:hypothetical protein